MSDDATLDEFTETNSGGGAAEKEVTKPTSWGKIPPDWDENTISEITQLVTDGSHNPPKRVEDGIQILSGRNIQNGYIDFNKEPSYISQSDFEQMDNNHSLRQGDLLMTIVGSIGRSAIVNKKTDFALQRSIALLRTNERVTTPFLKYITDSGRFYKQADSRSRATAQGGLYLEALNKINLPVPSPSEQRKIATVLHTVDQAIQKLDEVIEQASYLKKGVMQDLFTEGYYQHNNQKVGSLRWENIPKSWSLPQLSEVVSINPNYNEVNRLVDYIEMDAVDTDLPEPSYIGHRNPQENSGRLFRQGDTLFARITPCTENGKICFVRSIDSETGIGSTEYAVLSPENKLLPKYLYHYTRTHQVRDYAISRMRGSTGRQRVPFDVFRKELHIPLPTEEEQQEIVGYLDSIDSIIRVNSRKQEQLHRLKSGLMQDLLSGKVRISDDNVDVPEEVAKYG